MFQVVFIISLFFTIRRLFFFYKKNFKEKALSHKTKIDIILVHLILLTIPCFLFYNIFFTYDVLTFISQPFTSFVTSGYILIFTLLFAGICIFSSDKFAQRMSNEKTANTVKSVLPQKKTNIIDDISQFISDLIDLSLYLYLTKIKREYTEANLIADNWKNTKPSTYDKDINDKISNNFSEKKSHQDDISVNTEPYEIRNEQEKEIFSLETTSLIYSLIGRKLFCSIDVTIFHDAINKEGNILKVEEKMKSKIYPFIYKMSKLISCKDAREEWEKIIFSRILFKNDDIYNRFDIYIKKRKQEDITIEEVFEKYNQIISDNINGTKLHK